MPSMAGPPTLNVPPSMSKFDTVTDCPMVVESKIHEFGDVDIIAVARAGGLPPSIGCIEPGAVVKAPEVRRAEIGRASREGKDERRQCEPETDQMDG